MSFPSVGTREPTAATVAAQAAGPQTSTESFTRRNEVERSVNALKGFRSVATRYDKRAYVFQGSATAVTVRLWLKA